ncbi:MAG: FKBP-type peptidyl-prolyl cis-trans isomerase [Treponematales bacterium]
MKRVIAVFLCALAAGLVFAEGIAEESAASAKNEELSYCFGMVVGEDLRTSGVRVDYGAFARGLAAAMETGGAARFSLEEAMLRVREAFAGAAAAQAAEAREDEARFLAANADKAGVFVSESGLQYEVLEEGTGASPEAGDTVTVNYEGTLRNGTVFDSSYARGESERFALEDVIPGWAEGLSLMKAGGKSRLYIPSELGYGADGAGDIIPPYATLIFNVELLEVQQRAEEDIEE